MLHWGTEAQMFVGILFLMAGCSEHIKCPLTEVVHIHTTEYSRAVKTKEVQPHASAKRSITKIIIGGERASHRRKCTRNSTATEMRSMQN